jgi:cystine transport system substrate-binding protein
LTLAAAALLLAGAAAQAADLLDTVKARGAIKVALEGTYPPFNYKDQKSGELAGFDVDVAKLLAAKLGVKTEFVTSEWASILAGLQAGKYDVIVSQVTVNPKREQAFDFSVPYGYSMPQLVVRKDEKAQYATLADLKGKRLGVGQGSVYEQQAKAVPGIDVRSYPAAPENLRDLAVGRVDAALNDSLMTAYLLKASDLPIKAGAKVGKVEKVAAAFKKGNPQLKAAIDKALAEAAADGSLKAISVKWFGVDVSKAP